MLVDFHTHCFPDKLALRALEKIGFDAGGLEYYTSGTFESLKSYLKRSRTDMAVVLNIATNAHQQTSVNDFAASLMEEEGIFPFGSVYPDAPNVMEELERIKAMGMKGVKFHPEFQNFRVDEDRMKPIYKKISSLGLITVFHAGADHGFGPDYKCAPKDMLRALSWFDTPVIAAHWGGLFASEDVLRYLCGTPIYMDTSMGYLCMQRSSALRIVEKHGTERLLFGTDSPWHTAEQEHRLLLSLNLTQAELDAIDYKNAFRLLGLSES
jgi:predicted TIM-barrel fold metal-dependent hydrolase